MKNDPCVTKNRQPKTTVHNLKKASKTIQMEHWLRKHGSLGLRKQGAQVGQFH